MTAFREWFTIHLHPGPNFETTGLGWTVSSEDLAAYVRDAAGGRTPAKRLLVRAGDLIAIFSPPHNDDERMVLTALLSLSEPDADMALVERIDHAADID